MDKPDASISFPKPVEVRDTQAYEIALRQNVAANGRLFCFMLFLLCLVLWPATHYGDRFIFLAALCPLSVGLSTIIDPLPVGRVRLALSCVAYGVPVGVSLSILSTLLIAILG
jgi:hypothetical protein